MNLLRKSKVFMALLATSLSGCASYLNNNDSVTLGVGNAPQTNLAVHTIDPFPPKAGNTNIKVAASKTEDALERYNTPGDPAVVGDEPASSGLPIQTSAN